MTSLAADGGEFLEDGAWSGTPDGDNLLLDFARAEAAGYGEIVAANGGRLLDDDELGLHLRDLGVGTPFGNPALLSRPVRDTDAVLERLHAFYRGHDGGPFIVFSPWPTDDWTAGGFVRVGHPPLMVRPAGPLGGAATSATATAGELRIERVGDGAALEDFERTLVEAYPVPELQPWAPRVYLAPEVLGSRWRFFVGYLDDRPVATAAAYVTDAVTLVELVSARPEHRGRGFGAAVTAAATLTEPDRPSMLIASDHGRGIYTALGYVPLLRYTLWLGLR